MEDRDKQARDYAEDYDNKFAVRKIPRSLISRRSAVEIVHEQDEDGNWRQKIRMQVKRFNDERKATFLEEYRKWGRMGEAAAAAGVTTQTVRYHMTQDEDFAQAMLVAEEEYKDKLIAHHQDLVFNGQEKVHYDRNGNIMSRETIYPVRLIELELKKHDAGYRDKQELAVHHTGGVLVAPAEMPTIDDWEKRFSAAKDVTPPDEE